MKNKILKKTFCMSLSCILLGLLFWGSNLALAQEQEGRYKKAEAHIKAKESKTTKIEKKVEKEEKFQPALRADQFRATYQAKVVELTEAAIKKLLQLIEITDDDDPEKADFYFRLAEHYRDKGNQYEFKARDLDDPIYKAKDAEKQRFLQTQKNYEKLSYDWTIKSIKMYLVIAQQPKWGKYARMDEVLYNVADMLNKANRQDRAREFFRQLIRNYPQSKYIPDAYLSFAEFYFNTGKIEEALRLYEQVGKYPDSPIFGYSIYKQGWCWLNLKDPRKALELFVKVIQNAEQWAGPKKGKIILVKEARKDSVRAFSHVGKPSAAWNFFKRLSAEHAPSMLESLANLYYDQGKFLEAIRIFKQLMGLDPQSKKLCSWQYAVMRSTLSGKDKAVQVQEALRLVAVQQATSKRTDLTKAALTECRNNAAGVLRELATTWHVEAQKTQNPETYALAEHLYRSYLKDFPKEKDTYEMGFYYAELLFKLKRWQDAAEAYTNVVTFNPRGKYLKEAAYAAVISWKNALNVEEEIKDFEKTTGKDKLQEKEIPENQQKMLATFDTYLKYVPDAKERINIMYRKARIYYEYNHFKKAADLFSKVVVQYSEKELAVYSANLLLDCLNILKEYDDMERWARKYLENEKLLVTAEEVEPTFKPTIQKLIAQIERKKCAKMQDEKMWRAAAECYAIVANKYPNHEKWAELLYNSAICYEAAKLVGQAINVRNTLIKIKPEDPLAQKSVYMIGANYHALSWYSRAAEYYEEFARKFPGEKEAPDALQNAIVFRLGRGEYSKAREDIDLFLKNYRGRKQYYPKSAAVFFSLGLEYEQKSDIDGLVKHYNEYLKTWGKWGGIDRQILAHVKIGEAFWNASCPTKTVNGACIKVDRVRSKRTIKKRKSHKQKQTVELRTQCGPETKQKITVIDRNSVKSKQAQTHFKQALDLFKKVEQKKVKGEKEEERIRRKQDMLHAAASARFHQAEVQFEDFLKVKFPQGLDFSQDKKNEKKRKQSEKDFGKYLDDKGKKLKQTSDIYEDVIKMKAAHWAIAASARIGQLYQNFADALFTAPVPKPPIPKTLIRKEDKEDFMIMFTDTYCDTLENKASPLEDKAVEGLGICLQKSTELSWYNEWSQLCESELNQIKPAEYPLASEIRAHPGYVIVNPGIVPVIENIK